MLPTREMHPRYDADRTVRRRGRTSARSLADAVSAHVRPGDAVHVMLGHSRWTAGARELTRQFWDQNPGFTLIMTSLGALGALFFEGGLVKKVITTYSGNSFPTYTPNPIFRKAYESGQVEVEHWSILTLAQRMEAAARGLPAMVTGSLVGSSMAENDAFSVVDSLLGPLGVLAPLAPDVALVHAAVADRQGNLAFSEPMLEGVWGALAARRGVVATVEQVVDDLDGLGHRVRGAGPPRPGRGRGALRRASGGLLRARSAGAQLRRGHRASGTWPPTPRPRASSTPSPGSGSSGPATHDDYLAKVGAEQLQWLEGRSDPASWRDDAAATPVVDDPTVTTLGAGGRPRGP